ncbi:DUF2059 domain-containing protein [Sulfitobacter albidus]|uniref:DUF2059 domain-containing protein n=1 Tax=Sulfitobacter albidus TaxID=2829501 RepID=A0A975JFN1_9RHOB|nr:DUF2059 domain-containing protein [Sulfitobacter albidus]QUJ77649.1 DUF2059 domain-containing protein [Sulfitobacter albidus]
MRAVLTSALAALLCVTLALPVWANARHTVLMDVLRINELTAILHAEGLAFGESLNIDWLDGRGGAAWNQQVARIYDRERLAEGIRAGLEPSVTGDTLETAIEFFASDLGQRVLTLENSAREAMADAQIEEAARARHAQISGTNDPRLAQIARMIDAGDLINRNVTSALNSNVQFMRALVDGGLYEMSEDEILSDVLAERDSIEADTTGWIYAFLLLAYSPLTLEELTAYADFSETRAGKALNAGFFAGFDPLYADISYALGRAMVLNMAAEEL